MDPVSPRGTLTNLAISALFLGTISLPAIAALCGVQEHLLNEKRRLADFPALALKRQILEAFPKLFEAYVNDQLPFRDRLIRWNNLAKLQLLGISPHINVTLGKLDWLFLTYEDVGTKPDTRKCRPFSPTELVRCQELIDGHTRWCAERGIRYIFLITPDKQTIYPELYPRKRSIRLDQLLDHMRTHSQAVCPDLRGPLLQAKAEHEVYFRTDSHWNDYGAYACYQSVSELLCTWYPHVCARPLSDFTPVAEPCPDYITWYYGDLSCLLGGLTDRYNEDWSFLRPRGGYHAHKTDEVVRWDERTKLGSLLKAYSTEQADSTLPKALVFHDSFGVRLAPLLSEDFRRAVFIPASSFDPDVIEREHPDVVIFQIVERKLEYLVPPDPQPATP